VAGTSLQCLGIAAILRAVREFLKRLRATKPARELRIHAGGLAAGEVAHLKVRLDHVTEQLAELERRSREQEAALQAGSSKLDVGAGLVLLVGTGLNLAGVLIGA
jgi:outer membrane protein TolC